MKKLTIILFSLVPVLLFAQNLQLHYDFGEDRKYLTSTLEMYKPDEYGATFLFCDIDYNYSSGNKSASLAYFEIARYISLPIDRLSATVQYNDGTVANIALGPVWLGGASYAFDLSFMNLSMDLLFRSARGSDASDGQVTVVFSKSFLDNRLTFKGFVDVWSQDEAGSEDRELVILSEPQIWYSFDKHLAIGGEVEISRNFVSADEFKLNPTLALKWEF